MKMPNRCSTFFYASCCMSRTPSIRRWCGESSVVVEEHVFNLETTLVELRKCAPLLIQIGCDAKPCTTNCLIIENTSYAKHCTSLKSIGIDSLVKTCFFAYLGLRCGQTLVCHWLPLRFRPSCAKHYFKGVRELWRCQTFVPNFHYTSCCISRPPTIRRWCREAAAVVEKHVFNPQNTLDEWRRICSNVYPTRLRCQTVYDQLLENWKQ